ncbi:MAG: SDR family NAD(P)-dependent oxidoreductase, partial [Solirubrobacterales bacterium]
MAQSENGAVLVTGASTGIGRATALHLDQSGYRVFAGVRKQADADSLKEEGSESLTPITLDVTEPPSIATAREEVQLAVGDAGLAGLVNNAGVANAGPVEHLPVEEFEKV